MERRLRQNPLTKVLELYIIYQSTLVDFNNLRSVHAYSYGVINDQSVPMEVTINCAGSKNMLFSTKSEIIKKVDLVLNLES